MAASIQVSETPLVLYTLRRADDALVLGHRLSEWCGHAPSLEEDMALANIGLDLLGQARSLYSYAAEVEAAGHDEDAFAYLRDAPQYRNLLLLEQPNGDFAQTMVRQFFYSAFADPYWRAMMRVDRPDAGRHRRQERERERLPPPPQQRVDDPPGRRHGGEPPPGAGRGGRAVALHRRDVRAGGRGLARRSRSMRRPCATGGGAPWTISWHRRRSPCRPAPGCTAAGARGGIPSISAPCWRKCSTSSAATPARGGEPAGPCAGGGCDRGGPGDPRADHRRPGRAARTCGWTAARSR